MPLSLLWDTTAVLNRAGVGSVDSHVLSSDYRWNG
ncbi:hypothetical protein A2U01_0022016, partial [Trifolium medium]|nr:hypothetical protein [Trifolium medium]